jgi:hypothetical protein
MSYPPTAAALHSHAGESQSEQQARGRFGHDVEANFSKLIRRYTVRPQYAEVDEFDTWNRREGKDFALWRR